MTHDPRRQATQFTVSMNYAAAYPGAVQSEARRGEGELGTGFLHDGITLQRITYPLGVWARWSGVRSAFHVGIRAVLSCQPGHRATGDGLGIVWNSFDKSRGPWVVRFVRFYRSSFAFIISYQRTRTSNDCCTFSKRRPGHDVGSCII